MTEETNTHTQAPEPGLAVRRSAIAGSVLIAAACMPILGATSIAPLQPAMAAAFPEQENASVIVSLILTTPALIIGLTATIAGRVIDLLGRKRVMVVALLLYALFGTAPLWLPNLETVLISRIGVGIAEAAIFTGATAMIADLFSGNRRARYFGSLNIATGLSAVVFIAASGALGGSNWRVPFWLYLLALPLALLSATLLPSGGARVRESLPQVQWRSLVRPLSFTLAGGIIFYAPVSMLSLRLDQIGIHDLAIIGLASAVAALALAVTAASFPAVLRRRPSTLLPLAFVLLGIGLLVIGLADSPPVVIAGAVIANAGGGLMLPTLQNWTLQRVAFDQRGRAAGGWTAANFIGQFICPLLVLGLGAVIGLGWALALVGIGALVIAVVGHVVGDIHSNTEAPATDDAA